MSDQRARPWTLIEKLISLQVRMQGVTDGEIDEALTTPATRGADKVVVVNVDVQETGPRPEYASTRTA
jgi:hypothetical protein